LSLSRFSQQRNLNTGSRQQENPAIDNTKSDIQTFGLKAAQKSIEEQPLLSGPNCDGLTDRATQEQEADPLIEQASFDLDPSPLNSPETGHLVLPMPMEAKEQKHSQSAQEARTDRRGDGADLLMTAFDAQEPPEPAPGSTEAHHLPRNKSVRHNFDPAPSGAKAACTTKSQGDDAQLDLHDDDQEDFIDENQEEDFDADNLESAENMDIISELQIKQQEIAMKKDGLLKTDQGPMEGDEGGNHNELKHSSADEGQAQEKDDLMLDELPEVHPPFLPAKDVLDQPYTLVLDLDETLIHFVSSQDQDPDDQRYLEELEEGENDFFYMVRPYCNKFLTELSKFYEIVIFTAAMQDYADWIIEGIDHRGAVRHRLYRQHCIQKHEAPQTDGEVEQGFQSIKDLRLLGRDIKKTIIIDNLKENFWSTCPNNGIEIESWYGEDLDDTELLKLIPALKCIVQNEEKDVRKVIKHYREDLA